VTVSFRFDNKIGREGRQNLPICGARVARHRGDTELPLEADEKGLRRGGADD
jgi:hypothetical protein